MNKKFYKGDMIEIINLPDFKNQFFKIGYRYIIKNVFDDFVSVFCDNTANNFLKFYEIILYKRPFVNKIKKLLQLGGNRGFL